VRREGIAHEDRGSTCRWCFVVSRGGSTNKKTPKEVIWGEGYSEGQTSTPDVAKEIYEARSSENIGRREKSHAAKTNFAQTGRPKERSLLRFEDGGRRRLYKGNSPHCEGGRVGVGELFGLGGRFDAGLTRRLD